jgi:hypothetical protein
MIVLYAPSVQDTSYVRLYRVHIHLLQGWVSIYSVHTACARTTACTQQSV